MEAEKEKPKQAGGLTSEGERWMCDVKSGKPDTMKKVIHLLEQKLAGKRVFRFLEEAGITEIYAEEFFRDIRTCAGELEKHGLAGCHIGLMGRSSYAWLVSFCAVFLAGGVTVLLDRETDPEMLKSHIRRTDAEGLLCDGELSADIKNAGILPDDRIYNMESVWKEAGQEERTPLCGDKSPGDLACIFFTSGTTAEHKAVMVSEGGLAAGLCHRINDQPFHALLSVLPFHHISGFSSVLNALYLGKEVCLAVEPQYFFRCLREMKPDYVFIVPSMLRMLARKLKDGGPNGQRLGWNLHMINCGGASFQPEYLQMMLEHGITVFQGYGASEAGAIGFLWQMTPEKPDTIGKPPEEMEAKLEDGELYLKSDGLMMGYYGDPGATREVLKEGWYATGDLCRVDEDGYYYLTGRKKNLILMSNGENVSPEEIESKLYRCEAIREVMIIGENGLMTAVVYPVFPERSPPEQEEAVREEILTEIQNYNRTVPLYKQIRKIRFRKEPFPRNAAGKLIRRCTEKGEAGNDEKGS